MPAPAPLSRAQSLVVRVPPPLSHSWTRPRRLAPKPTDALLLLMIVDHREGRPGDAMKRLAVLERAHPLNRLLLVNHAASALAAKQPQAADEMLSKGIGN